MSHPIRSATLRAALIVSNSEHPFAGEQYITLGITTNEYPDSLPLDGAFETGTLSPESFASPWSVVSPTDLDIDRAVARLTGHFTDDAVEAMTQYVFD